MSEILKSLNVLVVDDEPGTLKLMSEVLGGEFGEVISAKNGDEGLKKFKKYSPDIVVSDIAMPIMDGLDMANAIKQISPSTPVIILSAHSEKERLLQAIDISIDKYIIKPIDMDDLIGSLELLARTKIEAADVAQLGDGISFDRGKKCLFRDGEVINLSKRELAFVSLLVSNLGYVVDMQTIKDSVWQNKAVNETAVRTFVKRIRDKAGVNFIKNIPTIGYKIDDK